MGICDTQTFRTDVEDVSSVARSYLERGWAVIPVRGCQAHDADQAKRPSIDQWKPYQERPPSIEELRQWDWPGVAIVCGSVSGGLVVLDVDGEDGEASMAGRHLPHTVSAHSPHGRHYYFAWAAPEPCPGPRVGLLDGVDIRAKGSYIVAPPTRVPGAKQYVWAECSSPDEAELAPVPRWLAELLLANPKPHVSGQTASSATIERGARNSTMASLAGTMRVRGFGEDAILAALIEENKSRCTPPLPEKELRTIARSIGRYAVETAATEPSALGHTTASRMMEFIGAQEWLWEKWLPIGHMTLMAGLAGVGKSVLALHLEISVASGDCWPDHTQVPGEPGHVIHMEAEGFHGGYAERLRNWGVARDVSDRLIWPGEDGLSTICLNDPRHLQWAEQMVDDYQAKLMVVDSLRQAVRDDENDSSIAQTLKPLVDLCRHKRCALLVLHHIGKSYREDRPPCLTDLRGSGAIGDMCRSALGLWRPNRRRPGVVRVEQLKPSLISAEDAAEARFEFSWDAMGRLHFALPTEHGKEIENTREKAEEFIVSEMTSRGGTARRSDIVSFANAEGYSTSTTDRAAKALRRQGVLQSRIDGSTPIWQLCPQADAAEEESPDGGACSDDAGEPD